MPQTRAYIALAETACAKEKNTMNGVKKSIGNGLARGAFAMVAAASLFLTAASARAACGSLSGAGSKTSITLPMLGQAASDNAAETSESIVGLWHVVYTAGGSVFNETLDQWHSDGTEFENAYLPVAAGNICFGVWKLVGTRTVRLHHIGWTYNATAGGTANGTFTLDETNTVSSDGKSYSGEFTFTTYPNKGSGVEVKGTIAATRITVD